MTSTHHHSSRGRPRGSAAGPPITLNVSSATQTMATNIISAQNLSKTAESLFSSHLASALNTISDSQYFQDSISPSSIRHQFETNDPSNPNSTAVLMNNMKWLLASMSKGRDVSDFFPHVVKLVSCPSLEIRKMVYTYLTHYADHDASCRDLSLLSINAFQRDLSDSNPFIRPLALRVLTSIRVVEVLQIQILAVQTCGKDSSPHVRKCAANALAKLYPRSDSDSRAVLKNCLKDILMEENCTTVLSSAMVSFVEMCPEELDLLHGCFRKICHLLTDMDEWGQIVVLDVMQRYCRTYFKKPDNNRLGGESAEVIDGQRKVVRTIQSDGTVTVGSLNQEDDWSGTVADGFSLGLLEGRALDNKQGSRGGIAGGSTMPVAKQKRRVVRKGFYSDEEDESSEEEVVVPSLHLGQRAISNGVTGIQKRDVMGFHTHGNEPKQNPAGSLNVFDEEESLHEDHRLLLRSSLPLLKSRNAGVVLGVCSLHYYCGIASIQIRSALGKALVRIYHDRREIQFVVLNSIRSLVWECPSAFTPFLRDFFVKAMDPSFTRLVKLDILSALCLEPDAILAVLQELRTYIRHHDKEFVCASIRLVGKLSEMARIVHDRIGKKAGNAIYERDQANKIGLNCLSGLVTLSEVSDHEEVVGECVGAMHRIMLLLQSQEGVKSVCDDPNRIQEKALRRLLLLALRSMSGALEDMKETEAKSDDMANESDLQGVMLLTTDKVSPALWMIGEWLTGKSNSLNVLKVESVKKADVQYEVLRLIAKTFILMDKSAKCQAVHMASKVLLTDCSKEDFALSEFILSLGRIDVIHDVRDRARFESLLIYLSKGIRFDSETLPAATQDVQKLSIDQARLILLSQKPASSWLPIESEGQKQFNIFRFGTLSSLLSRQAGAAYYPLPSWAESDSPTALRDPVKSDPLPSAKAKNSSRGKSDGWIVDNNKKTEFYDSSDSSSPSDGSSSSDSSSESSVTSSSSSSSENDESSVGSSSDTDESTSSDDVKHNDGRPPHVANKHLLSVDKGPVAGINSSDTSSNDESSSNSEDESSVDGQYPPKSNGVTKLTASLIDVNYDSSKTRNTYDTQGNDLDKDYTMSTLANGLEGLVMAPIVYDKDVEGKGNIESESSMWISVVRHELSGGLEASIRFLRGSSRQNEAKLMGLNPQIASVICFQFKFENKRSDGCPIRRIRLIPKKNPKTNIVPVAKSMLPLEIATLDTTKISYAVVGIEFSQASDKDGAMWAKFDVKSDRGVIPIDICPSLAELIEPIQMSQHEFDTAARKLQGIHQQTMASFKASFDNILETVLKVSSIAVVEECTSDLFKFAGVLPASRTPVLLSVKCSSSLGSVDIQIYCDNAMALSPLLSSFKSAISNDGIEDKKD